MGWTIQHAPGATENRPYTLVAEALDAAKATDLPKRHHGALTNLLHRLGYGATDDVSFTPKEAAEIRGAADAAVSRLRFRPSGRKYLPFLRDLAEAADTAARSGRPWRWS